MKNNLEKDFKEVKQLLQDALKGCKNIHDLRFFLHQVITVAAEDYKNMIIEQKISIGARRRWRSAKTIKV